MLAYVHNAGMTNWMLATERPTCRSAGGAFFALGGGRLAVKDAGTTPPKRQFEPGSPHHSVVVTSGTGAAETAPAPDHQPRDLAPRKMTASNNLTVRGSFFQNAVQFPQMTDLARHEHPL